MALHQNLQSSSMYMFFNLGSLLAFLKFVKSVDLDTRSHLRLLHTVACMAGYTYICLILFKNSMYTIQT